SGIVLPRLRDIWTKLMDKQLKSRRFCFTIPNYSEEDLERFHILAQELKDHCYISYGIETGETGFPHIQGYVELYTAQRYAYLQKYFDFKKDGELLKFHVEKANGTAEENRKYTQKEGNSFEYGEPLKQGSRTDLSEIKEAVSMSPRDITKIVHNLIQNNQQLKFAEGLQRYYLPHRDPAIPPRVFWLYGQTGIGKTSLVFRTFKDICAVSSYDWLGTDYMQNECFLLDDYRGFDINFNELLRLTDRFPYTLYFKGGQIPFNSPYIVITSPLSIDQTFRGNNENLQQLKRRVIEIDLDMELDIDSINLRNYQEGA
ncbi:MAG: hypothetical protein ABIT47_02510, partial [Candidatus Paceibacterota bacterium]